MNINRHILVLISGKAEIVPAAICTFENNVDVEEICKKNWDLSFEWDCIRHIIRPTL